MHQNNAAGTHVRNVRGGDNSASASAYGPTGVMDSTQHAQVHAWDTPFAADDFSVRNKHPTRIPTARDARRPPPIVTHPVKASRHQSHRAQTSAYSRSPVSPLAQPTFVSRIPRPRTFADVSPLSSPGRSRGHGQPS